MMRAFVLAAELAAFCISTAQAARHPERPVRAHAVGDVAEYAERAAAPRKASRHHARVKHGHRHRKVKRQVATSRRHLATSRPRLCIAVPGLRLTIDRLEEFVSSIALLDSAVASARAYLIQTATPGRTMSRQGTDVAIGRIHPEFAIRLARAIMEARSSGLPRAGIFSAYRPPGFGIGGFTDKFASLHSYGLAVDMTGIGRASSKETILWFRIAGRNKLFNPYGPYNRAEHNHYQLSTATMISRGMDLRGTITAAGPKILAAMWQVGDALVSNRVWTELPAAQRHRLGSRHRWAHRKHYVRAAEKPRGAAPGLGRVDIAGRPG